MTQQDGYTEERIYRGNNDLCMQENESVREMNHLPVALSGHDSSMAVNLSPVTCRCTWRIETFGWK